MFFSREEVVFYFCITRLFYFGSTCPPVVATQLGPFKDGLDLPQMLPGSEKKALFVLHIESCSLQWQRYGNAHTMVLVFYTWEVVREPSILARAGFVLMDRREVTGYTQHKRSYGGGSPEAAPV